MTDLAQLENEILAEKEFEEGKRIWLEAGRASQGVGACHDAA